MNWSSLSCNRSISFSSRATRPSTSAFFKAAINDANREAQRDIYDLAEKRATAQFLAGVSTRHGPQPAVYPNTTEVSYVAALKKADVDALVARLEKEIDQLQDKLDQFNHAHRIEVDGRTLELAS